MPITVIFNGSLKSCPEDVREALEQVYTRGEGQWEALVEASPRHGGCKLTVRGPQGHWRLFRVPTDRCRSAAYMAAVLRAETMAFPSLPPRSAVHAIGELEHLGLTCELGRLFSGSVAVEGQVVSSGDLAELYRTRQLGVWASRLKSGVEGDDETGRRFPMTIAEFLERLADVARRFDWSMVQDPPHPEDRRARPRRRIRCRPSGRPDSSVTLDPLRAVCYTETGEMHASDGWADAGSALGLNVADAKDIADAADDLAWSGVDGERFPDRELGALRFRLLEIVGLTSSPKPQDWRSEAENRSST